MCKIPFLNSNQVTKLFVIFVPEIVALLPSLPD